MKHTEQQIIEVAVKVMEDIDWSYDDQEIRAIFESKEATIEKDRKYIQDQELLEFAIKNAKPDHWIVFFEFDAQSEIENNSMHLFIWDDTAEPFEIKHKQAGFKIFKRENGSYYTEPDWKW